MLLFNHNKQYIGGVNVYVDPTFNRVQMIGIKGSLYKIMGRDCGKGESEIASKILQAVRLYAVEHIRDQIIVLGPVGKMPEILKKFGFELEKNKRVTFLQKDYYSSIYNPDGSPKVFSNINLKKIDINQL